MSRQLSSQKMKSDADIFKFVIQEGERKRPGSGQPLSTIKSPLPPRKPVFSGQQQKQQSAIVGRSSVPQNSLPFIKSPVKSQKPPIQKIIISKQEQHTSESLTAENKARNKSNSQKVTSAGNNTKNFTWNEVGEPHKQQNKRRLVSREKLQSLPAQQLQQHFNQPKCFHDFTMTSGRNDLQKVFASLQMEIKEAASQADQNPILNMSEIIEQADDGCSSLAQSTLFQQ